jgi:hypothetical protein
MLLGEIMESGCSVLEWLVSRTCSALAKILMACVVRTVSFGRMKLFWDSFEYTQFAAFESDCGRKRAQGT